MGDAPSVPSDGDSVNAGGACLCCASSALAAAALLLLALSRATADETAEAEWGCCGDCTGDACTDIDAAVAVSIGPNCPLLIDARLGFPLSLLLRPATGGAEDGSSLMADRRRAQWSKHARHEWAAVCASIQRRACNLLLCCCRIVSVSGARGVCCPSVAGRPEGRQ